MRKGPYFFLVYYLCNHGLMVLISSAALPQTNGRRLCEYVHFVHLLRVSLPGPSCACILSPGERVPGRRPVPTGQLPVRGGGVGCVCRVRPGAAEHPTLPPLPHAVHNARHAGLQRPRQRLLHGAAQR